MPNIRIMNWNIEKLSRDKALIPGMANNIGKIIANSQADIVIILELTAGTGGDAMDAIAAGANAAAVVLGGGAHDYTAWFVSHITGGEMYGVLIKNLDQVRPLYVLPDLGQPTGEDHSPLNDTDANRFAIWPAPLLPFASAYPLGPATRPRLPLTDVHSSPPRPRAPTLRRRFGGRTLAKGGMALGRGFRMPCLAMFQILNTPGTATYVLPILVCHLGAVRGGANRLARGQIRQYKEVHITQKFQGAAVVPRLTKGGYIQVFTPGGGADPVRIRELVITGDFNVDFLRQNPPGPANTLNNGNRNALNTVTSTSTNGGTHALPAAMPGVPDAPGWAPPGIPAVPFHVLGPTLAPDYTALVNLDLKTAVTRQGTILVEYDPGGAMPADFNAALRGACFDNFYFGGTQLSATFQTLTPPPPVGDGAEVINIPAQIVANAGHVGAGPAQIDVSGAWSYYFNPYITAVLAGAPSLPAHHYTHEAMNLNVTHSPLTANDRLIGARLISDHLPVVVQFNLP